MNLVGKIFIVLIFVFTLVVMVFAMVVYATGKNWRDEVMRPQAGAGKELGLKFKLDEANAENGKLKAENDKLTQEYNSERAALTQQVTTLENEKKLLSDERKQQEKAYAELVTAQRDAVAQMKVAQENMTHSEKERDAVEAQVDHAQQDRDAHFKEVRRLTDELNQAANEKEQLNKRLTTLAADLAKAKEALRYFDINEKSDYQSKTPPRVDAMILDVNGQGLVEIDSGSDAGLRVGHRLEVVRSAPGGANSYVGRIEVIKTTPDKSVCKIDPKFQNSNMMRGDRVVSKIE